MTIKSAIFDLDGTLLDTLDDLRTSLESAIREQGLNIAFDNYSFKQKVGNGLSKLICRALPLEFKEDPVMTAKVRSAFEEIYSRNLTVATKPYPGIKELLNRLKSEDFRLGVWSNKGDDNVKTLMDHFFPGIFTSVKGATPQSPIKPEPQVGLELAELLGAKPESIYYLGDSEVDMETARRCGFIPFGVAWGFRSAQALSQAGAKVILEKPSDLYLYMDLEDGKPE